MSWIDFSAASRLVRSERIAWVRLRRTEALVIKREKWTKRWKTWVTPTTLPGIWLRKEGGHLVRARIVDPATGRMKEIKKVLPETDQAMAHQWLTEELARIRAGVASAPPQQTRFADYAVSLLERKAERREIKSAKGRERWRYTLEHLIAGTTGEKSERFVSGFGEFFLDKLHVSHVEQWKTGIAGLIAAGDYAPTTANSWLSILRVILKAAKREFQLQHLATDGVEDFDTSEHTTYTEEEPNALLPEEVGVFLGTMRELYPQHYAMVYLGLATGLRPSSLRPLRRRGPSADVLWEQSRLLVRRSQTLGDEVMNTTKQGKRYSITVPQELMAVLEWHVRTQLSTPEQEDSDLLFPSVKGSYRSPCVLNKPFADVCEAMGLGRHFSQRGLRRTFNDLARAAAVESVITRSISGHLTEQMQLHYSTVNPAEQRASIGKVINLMEARAERSGGAPKTASGAPESDRNELQQGALQSAGGAPSGAPLR
jgi:integrase